MDGLCVDGFSMDSSASDSDGASLTGSYVFSAPVSEDGLRVHELIGGCAPLDENSIYCNLLQCDHFAETCVKVEQHGQLVAFISGYIPPKEPDVLFIWQVAVSATARGQGLGGRMLRYLLNCPACANVRYMHTTVTLANDPSIRMFESFAKKMSAGVSRELRYDKNRHFGGNHDSEIRFAIGPLR